MTKTKKPQALARRKHSPQKQGWRVSFLPLFLVVVVPRDLKRFEPKASGRRKKAPPPRTRTRRALAAATSNTAPAVAVSLGTAARVVLPSNSSILPAPTAPPPSSCFPPPPCGRPPWPRAPPCASTWPASPSAPPPPPRRPRRPSLLFPCRRRRRRRHPWRPCRRQQPCPTRLPRRRPWRPCPYPIRPQRPALGANMRRTVYYRWKPRLCNIHKPDAAVTVCSRLMRRKSAIPSGSARGARTHFVSRQVADLADMYL